MREQDGRQPFVRKLLAFLEGHYRMTALALPTHWAVDGILLRDMQARAFVVLGQVGALDAFRVNPSRLKCITTLHRNMLADDGKTIEVLFVVEGPGGVIEQAKMADIDEDGYVKYDSWYRLLGDGRKERIQAEGSGHGSDLEQVEGGEGVHKAEVQAG